LLAPDVCCSYAPGQQVISASHEALEFASMAKQPQVGQQGPELGLPGIDGPFQLSDHRGERVVLLF